MKKPKYADDVIAKALRTRAQPGVYLVGVAHDDWCALLQGTGPCNCNPIVGEPRKVPTKK